MCDQCKCNQENCECEQEEYKLNEEQMRKDLEQFHKDLIKHFDGIENLMKWIKLMDYARYEIYEIKNDVAPVFCYDIGMMKEEPDFMYPYILEGMVKIGIKFPKKFPEDLDFDYYTHDENDGENDPERFACDIIKENKIGKFLLEFFETYGQVNAFRVAYVDPIIEELEEIDERKYEELFDEFNEINYDLIPLCFDKMELDKEFAPDKSGYVTESIKTLRDKIYMLKKLAYRYRICLGSELSYLFMLPAIDLDGEAEKESFGLNTYGRVHPDFYMNELINGIQELTSKIEDFEDDIEDIKDNVEDLSDNLDNEEKE